MDGDVVVMEGPDWVLKKILNMMPGRALNEPLRSFRLKIRMLVCKDHNHFKDFCYPKKKALVGAFSGHFETLRSGGLLTALAGRDLS